MSNMQLQDLPMKPQRFDFRVPPATYSALCILAAHNRRSINSQLLLILETHLQNLRMLPRASTHLF